MNGYDMDVKEILNKLNKIQKIQIQDLNIKYYIINLPIIDEVKIDYEKLKQNFIDINNIRNHN